jgi:pimeloyl-ACP methyl ester carboxylesterase
MLKLIMNGLELAYERRGQGTSLILIHGYPLDHSIWQPLVPLLENRFDLIMPDLRGFGQSLVGGSSTHLSDMAGDLITLMDHLQIQKALVAGHSMGGYVSLALARQHVSRLLGLGLIATQANADPPEKRIARNQLADRVEMNGVGEVADSMPALLTKVPHVQESLKDLILLQSSRGVAGALRAMAERPDSMDELSTLEVPVVIIHGLADGIMPVDRAREMRSAVKNGSLIEIEGVGHMPMIEAPQAVAEALEAFH